MEDSLPIMLSPHHASLQSRDKENHHNCFLHSNSAKLGGPKNSNRIQGKIFTPIIFRNSVFFSLMCRVQRIERPQNRVSRLAMTRYFDKLFIRMELSRS